MPLESTLSRDREAEYREQQSRTIQNIVTFERPGILVEFEGRLYRQRAIVDWPGASLAAVLLDDDGQWTIERLKPVRVVDPDVLPPSREKFMMALRGFDRGLDRSR